MSGLSRYTPASSLVSKPTSTLGSVGRGKRRKTESSNPGLSFAAQPAALTMAVSFTVWVKPHLAVMRLDYNDVASFVLARGPICVNRTLRGQRCQGASKATCQNSTLHANSSREVGTGQCPFPNNPEIPAYSRFHRGPLVEEALLRLRYCSATVCVSRQIAPHVRHMWAHF